MMADVAAISNPGAGAARCGRAPSDSRTYGGEQLLVQEAARAQGFGSAAIEVGTSPSNRSRRTTTSPMPQLREELHKQGMSLAAYRKTPNARSCAIGSSTLPWAPRSA